MAILIEHYTLFKLCLESKSEEALLFMDKHPENCFANYIDKDFDCTPLMVACNNKLEIVVLKMIDIYGFDCNPNYANKDGYNVLIISIMRQLLNVANKIIDRFGNEFKSDQLTIDGYSALFYCLI